MASSLTSFKSLISFSANERIARLWGKQEDAVRNDVMIFP